MATKKLYNGPTVHVDDQIIRWREKMRKEGRTLGRNVRKQKEEQKRRLESDREKKLINSGKKNFFE